MDLWQSQAWKKVYAEANVRHGLRVRYAADLNPEVKQSICRFISWVREEYDFPMRVVVYVKADKSIIARDKTLVNGTFTSSNDPYTEPYIRVATGDYLKNKQKWGRDDALATILHTIAHELTHYYQWLNKLNQTERGEECQATRYSHKIIRQYACVVDHP